MKPKRFLKFIVTITKTLLMNPVYIFFKSDMILKLKDNIILPLTGYFVLNANSIRLSCFIDQQRQYIHLTSRRSAARFLVKNGMFDFYKEEGGIIQLFRYTYFYKEQDGVFIQCTQELEIPWEEISLSTSDVKLLFARKEYNRCMRGEPLSGGAKIIRMGIHREDINEVA